MQMAVWHDKQSSRNLMHHKALFATSPLSLACDLRAFRKPFAHLQVLRILQRQIANAVSCIERSEISLQTQLPPVWQSEARESLHLFSCRWIQAGCQLTVAAMNFQRTGAAAGGKLAFGFSGGVQKAKVPVAFAEDSESDGEGAQTAKKQRTGCTTAQCAAVLCAPEDARRCNIEA